MKSMEFTGHSVDEAIFVGLTEMGVTIDEVEIETIQEETKGLFGIGAKQAVVRLTEREVPLVMEMEQVFQREEANKERRASEQRGGRRDGRPQRGRDGDRGPRERRAPAGSGYGREDRGERRSEEPEAPAEHYDYSEELAKETPCAVFLGELLEKMGISARVLAVNTENGLRLCIDAETMGLLIGRRGETLDALQYLVSLYANKNRKDDGYQRITLDTEGYRGRREETLRRLARRNAARVRQTGRSMAMEPMIPYERRVLNMLVIDLCWL